MIVKLRRGTGRNVQSCNFWGRMLGLEDWRKLIKMTRARSRQERQVMMYSSTVLIRDRQRMMRGMIKNDMMR